MKRRFHFPETVLWIGESPPDYRANVERVVRDAMRSAVAALHDGDAPVLVIDGDVSEPFDPSRVVASSGTYLVPSYDDGGEPAEVPVTQQAPQTPTEVIALIEKEFHRTAPEGEMHYGVQIGAQLCYVEQTPDGEVLRAVVFTPLKADELGHLTSLDTPIAYPTGRYVYEVMRKSDDPKAYKPYQAELRELGRKTVRQVWTDNPVGFGIAFFVPLDPYTTIVTADGGRGWNGGGLFGGRGLIRLNGCHPYWDTSQLTDPAYAGMTDDDLGRVFVNLCCARAIKNLDLCEEYIKSQLLPRFTGPGGSLKSLSEYSRHEVKHFEDNLTLLRGLVLTTEKLEDKIHILEKEYDDLTLTHYRTTVHVMFGGDPTMEYAWPTRHEPAPRDRQRADELLANLAPLGEDLRTTLKAIQMLVSEDPVLTQFMAGMTISSGLPQTKKDTPVTSLLAGVTDPLKAQRQILEQFDKMLKAIGGARDKLCREPERVLDVESVYEQVLTLVHGANPHFDEVAIEVIKRHQQEKMWADVGLGILGLVLFVGGLLISFFGGPAGVVGFLQLAGTVLGGVQALRSIDKAVFATLLSEASVQRGAGWISLDAAADARFWATLDTAFVAVDVALSGIKQARAIAAARKAERAAEAMRALEQGGKIPFEELFKLAGKGGIQFTPAELAALTSRNTKLIGEAGEAIAKRLASSSGEFVFLGTKVRANQGIDLLMVRKGAFEKVFGTLATNARPAELLAQATEEQQKALARILTAANAAEDLVSLEVKVSRAGAPVEELLKAARGGVAYNETWFRNLMTVMKQSKDTTVVASARLLEQVIGTTAQNIGRMTRVGVTITADGTFKLVRLNDQLIDLAQRSLRLWRGRAYSGLRAAVIEASRLNNNARMTQLQNLLRNMNAQIDVLDAAVKVMKQADASAVAVRAQEALMRAAAATREVADLQALSTTPATLDALFVANATLSLNLEIARQSMAQMDAEDNRLELQIKADAATRQPQFFKEIDDAIAVWDREDPGAKKRIEALADEVHRQRVASGEAQ